MKGVITSVTREINERCRLNVKSNDRWVQFREAALSLFSSIVLDIPREP